MESKNSSLQEKLSQNSIWMIFVLMVILVTILRPVFMSPANITGLLEGESIKGILAVGIMWAILSGGIDLSPGAIVALTSVVTASLVQNEGVANRLLGDFPQLPTIAVILIVVLFGATVGAITGVIIAYTGIPPFIATLGTQLICRAAAKMYSNRPVSNLPDNFRILTKGKVFGFVPAIVFIFILMFAISAFLLTQTRFGKNIYAIGGNRQAAFVAGINVKKNLVFVYIVSAVFAAVGGILLAARTGSADPSTSGLNYELDAIAAATIGGTSHTGGVCRISGVLAGILIMGVINNGLVLLSIDDNMTNVIKGLIIIVAVAFDMRKNKQAN